MAMKMRLAQEVPLHGSLPLAQWEGSALACRLTCRPIVHAAFPKPSLELSWIYELHSPQLCFTVLLHTESTSSFKLLTVEVHLLRESVEHRILKEDRRVGMKLHLSHESPFAASDLWAKHAQKQWREL